MKNDGYRISSNNTCPSNNRPLSGNFLKYSFPLNNRPPLPPTPFGLLPFFYPLVKSDPAKLISADSSSVAEDIAIEN